MPGRWKCRLLWRSVTARTGWRHIRLLSSKIFARRAEHSRGERHVSSDCGSFLKPLSVSLRPGEKEFLERFARSSGVGKIKFEGAQLQRDIAVKPFRGARNADGPHSVGSPGGRLSL